jgi:hypothetical protein
MIHKSRNGVILRLNFTLLSLYFLLSLWKKGDTEGFSYQIPLQFNSQRAISAEIKKPPKGGSRPSFSRFIRAYRFPCGMALAPLRKIKGCRAGYRANSLTATLDS